MFSFFRRERRYKWLRCSQWRYGRCCRRGRSLRLLLPLGQWWGARFKRPRCHWRCCQLWCWAKVSRFASIARYAARGHVLLCRSLRGLVSEAAPLALATVPQVRSEQGCCVCFNAMVHCVMQLRWASDSITPEALQPQWASSGVSARTTPARSGGWDAGGVRVLSLTAYSAVCLLALR